MIISFHLVDNTANNQNFTALSDGSHHICAIEQKLMCMSLIKCTLQMWNCLNSHLYNPTNFGGQHIWWITPV